ncbi:MAG TPA: flagellar hook-length control protein FliK [Sphingomonas sp.]|nr:flagellar hook-length control protein FliK [Sphingomonas sp.]
MNILPFGFPIGNGAGSGVAVTPQLPPSGLGFAVALDGALGGGAGIANGVFGFPTAGGSAAQIDGMPVLDLAAGTPASEATAGILPPAVPMAQLLTTAARISTPAAPAGEGPTEGAAVPVATDPAQPDTGIPVAEPKPAVTQPGAGIPAANPKPAATAEAPEIATPVTAGEQPVIAAEAAQPQAPGQPAKAQPQKSSRLAADAAEPPVAPQTPDAGSALPLPTAVPVAATAPLVQSQAAPAEPSAAAPAPRKIGTARSAPAASVQQDAPAAPPSADGGFARAVAGRGDADGQKGADAGQQQQQPLVQEAAAKPAGTQPAAHFQPAPASEPARHAAAAATPSPAAPAGEPVVTARPGQLGHSMGVEIARKIESGEETLRVRLNPAELGRVEVTLGFDDRGSLQATMRTESAQALDLLRQDVPDLARTLDQAGVRTDAQSFRFENRAGDGGGNQSSPQQQQRGNQQHAQQGDFETEDQPYRAIRGDGQVDLLA